MQKSNKTLWCNIMLIMTAVIWGSNFVFQKMAAAEMGPFTFMAFRYTLGTIVLALIAWFMEYRRKASARLAGTEPEKYGRAYFKKLFTVAPICVVANLAGNILVQWGLAYTDAGKAGFLNSIYIIFVPIVGALFFRRKTGLNIIVGTVLAVIGLYNLCMTEAMTLEKGDIIILSATITFALHILLVDKYVHELVGVHFSCAEFLFASIYSWIAALLFEDITMASVIGCAPHYLYSGIFGVGVCYALQVTAQKHTDPTVASLLMSLEAVFAAICGVLILHETFTAKELVGIAFIVTAIVIAQLPAGVFRRKTGQA